METHIKHLNESAESANGATLEYHDVQDKGRREKRCHSETPMVSILFDESHGQLLKSRLAKSKCRVDVLLEGEGTTKVVIAEKVDAESVRPVRH